MIIVHVLGDVSTKGRNRIGLSLLVFLGSNISSTGKSSNESYRFNRIHSKPCKVTKRNPECTRMFLQILLLALFDFLLVHNLMDSPHKINSSIGSTLEFLRSNRYRTAWIIQYILCMSRHARKNKYRTSHIIRCKPNHRSTRISRIRFGVGTHDSKSMIVFHQSPNIGGPSQFGCILLMFGKLGLNLGLFWINFNRTTITTTDIMTRTILTPCSRRR
mmetsp:Transcript_508/g.874  ORF Transcript_508/g.874 Transcript_508/m.874 type:complete len:217 (-) Transcript_508:236-886(-)